jgi:hypothetical protein
MLFVGTIPKLAKVNILPFQWSGASLFANVMVWSLVRGIIYVLAANKRHNLSLFNRL